MSRGATSVRRFELVRDDDETGISGTGVVAYGCTFPDGTCVLRWDTKVNSTVFYNSLDDLEHIHGHGGRTRVSYLDGEDVSPLLAADGNVFLWRKAAGYFPTPDDAREVLTDLRRSFGADVQLFVLGDGDSLEALPEKDMAAAGWVRK